MAYHTLSTVNTIVTSTDPDIINWLLSEIKIIYPSAELRQKVYDLQTNKIMSAKLYKLEGRDEQVKLWIRKKLSEDGWEPFAVTGAEGRSSSSYHIIYTYHYRKLR